MRSKVLTRATAGLFGAACLAVAAAATATAAPLNEFIPHRFAQPPTTADCETAFHIACYQPFQFQHAYDMNPLYNAGLNGAGRTIVIVDSFGSPTIQSDLKTFDRETGLPAPPSFDIITPAGTPPPYDPSNYDMGGWGVETSLDVEYAHTMAPGANILLVETPVDETIGVQGFPQMIEAENYVISRGLGDVISQSFGAGEQTFPSPSSIYALRSAYFNALFHRVTVLASSGDAGPTEQSVLTSPPGPAQNFFPFRVVGWPSSDPFVTSVGGTQLHLDANGNRTAPDNVWNDTALFGGPAASGGGVSSVFSRPFYQSRESRIVGRARGVPDVSMSAAVDGAALVYLSFVNGPQGIPGAGWYLIGGTSESSPLLSGIVAVADQAAGHRLGWLAPRVYEQSHNPHSGIVDVSAPGNNTVTFTQAVPGTPDYGKTYTVQGYNTLPGYDLTTGLGTVDGAAFVEHMARTGFFARDRH